VVHIPSQFEHWGLFVRYEDGTDKLYHADKAALTNIQTKYEEKDWSATKSKNMDCIVLVGYTSSTFNQDAMTKACEDVTRDRVFNTLSNNCQEWVKGVLSSLISDNYLAEGAFEELKFDSEITPLLGW
jgi:membrane-associated HD superfamily phosphohydrolase